MVVIFLVLSDGMGGQMYMERLRMSDLMDGYLKKKVSLYFIVQTLTWEFVVSHCDVSSVDRN